MTHNAVTLVEEAEAIHFAKQLIEIESVNPPGQEEEAAALAGKLMADIGMEVEIQTVAPGRSNALGWLRGGGGGPTLMMNGHLDVVPAGDPAQWHSPPFKPTLQSGRLYGRGACDMKGALASILEAVKAVKRSKIKLKGSLLVAMVADEESYGKGTIKLIEDGHKADMAVVTEPTNLKVLTAHKGVIWLEVTTFGRSAHASLVKSGDSLYGVNAIYKMARVISAFEQFLPNLEERKHHLVGNPTISVGTVTGGTKPNIVPDLCKIILERRLIPGERKEDAIEELEILISNVAQSDPDFKYDSKTILAREPAQVSDKERIVELSRNAVRLVTGKDSGVGGLIATTDMSLLVNDAHIPTVILGPGDIKLAHSPNEYVEIDDLVTASKVYAQLIINSLG